jgi:hypothetical protein
MSGDPPQVQPNGRASQPATPAATEASVSAVPGKGLVSADESVASTAATAAATVPAPAAAAAAATLPASAARRRGLAVVAGIGRLLRFALVVALFAAGIALGYRSFLAQPSAAAGPAADPATAGKQPAPVIQEFIAAVATNDADRIRSAVPAEPYKLFTSEIERWKFQQVTSVETLATYEDGQRAATAFVMLGLDTNGNPIAMNLVVETQDGNIVSFK